MASKYKRENARRVALSMPRNSTGQFIRRTQTTVTMSDVNDLELQLVKKAVKPIINSVADRMERANLELIRIIEELEKLKSALHDINKII